MATIAPTPYPASRSPLAAPIPSAVAPKRSSTPYISDAVRSPIPAWMTSAALLAAIPSTVRSPVGYPALPLLPLFSIILGGAGYMTFAGDSVNGPGTATAWSLIYLFLNGKKALLSRRTGPIAVSTVVAALASTSGWDYFYNS